MNVHKLARKQSHLKVIKHRILHKISRSKLRFLYPKLLKYLFNSNSLSKLNYVKKEQQILVWIILVSIEQPIVFTIINRDNRIS